GVRAHRFSGNRECHVNPIRSKTESKAIIRPGLLSGGSLKSAGDGRIRQMTIHDITRLIVRLWVFIFIIQKRQNERGRRTNRLPQTVLSVFLFLHFYSLYFIRFRRLTATPTIAAPKNRIYRPIRLSSPVFVERVLRSVPTAFSVLFLSRLFCLSV